MNGIAPIDAFEHVAELRRRDHYRAVRSLWPDEAATLQPLGIERHAEAIMPEDLDQLATACFIMRPFVRVRAVV
jgi:hypothetical protein